MSEFLAVWLKKLIALGESSSAITYYREKRKFLAIIEVWINDLNLEEKNFGN